MLFRAARASILIAVAVALSGCGAGAIGPTPPIDKATYVPPQQQLMAAGPLGERVLGKPDAPVTIVTRWPRATRFRANSYERVPLRPCRVQKC